MPARNKLLLGAIATFLLGWLFYAPFGHGLRFINDLEADAEIAANAVQNGNQARLRFDKTGVLYRRAIGAAPGLNEKERVGVASDMVNAVPGLFGIDWQDSNRPTATIVADTGAPASVAEVKDCQAQVNAALIGKTITFQSGGALLTADSQPLLDQVASALGPCKGTRVEVAGHTDAAGGTRRNLRLSEERANSVVEALIGRGIPGTRLLPRGYGESKPLDAGGSPEAYAKNRRIDFAVAAFEAGSKQ